MPKSGRRDRLSLARAHLRQSDPVLRALIDSHPNFDPRAWLAELPPMDAFGALVFQILGQQLSVSATRRLVQNLQERFGGRLPAPSEVVASDPEFLHACGLSRRKVQTLRALASEFVANRISDASLRAMSDLEIERRLTSVSGIGPWTVHGFLIIALDREDVVLPGDLALRKAIQEAYALDHLPSEDDVRRLSEPWRPHRSLATAYLFATRFEASMERARADPPG